MNHTASHWGYVIAAGGLGTRLNAEKPKQFLSLNQTPLLIHTLNSFVSLPFKQQVVVVPDGWQSYTRSLIQSHMNTTHNIKVITGGKTRFESVKRGVETATECDYILIHDAARPYASQDLVNRVIDATLKSGAAIPGIPVTDTVKWVENGAVKKTIPRERLVRVQTPQGFRRDWLVEAYSYLSNTQDVFTDEAMAMETMEHTVSVVAGEPENIKITTPHDMTSMTSPK